MPPDIRALPCKSTFSSLAFRTRADLSSPASVVPFAKRFLHERKKRDQEEAADPAPLTPGSKKGKKADVGCILGSVISVLSLTGIV